MFGSRKRRRESLESEGAAGTEAAPKRNRLGSAMFYVLGPATVEGALQGHSPEARQAWKDLLANSKRAREEAKRQQESTDTRSPSDL